MFQNQQPFYNRCDFHSIRFQKPKQLKIDQCPMQNDRSTRNFQIRKNLQMRKAGKPYGIVCAWEASKFLIEIRNDVKIK